MQKKQPPSSPEEQRSRLMSRVKHQDTNIEIRLRKALWHNEIRYRKNYSALPGSPDIAITKYKIAIFCDGEFWHGRDWVEKGAKLKSNRDYWIPKIERNIQRDNETDRRLKGMGWTVIRFWGREIEKNLLSCVDCVKEAILQTQIDAYSNEVDYADQSSESL